MAHEFLPLLVWSPRSLNSWICYIKYLLDFSPWGYATHSLDYTDQQILRHAGQISHSMALAKAEAEYEKYRVQRDKEYLSDFDRELTRYLKGNDVQ